MRRWFKRIFLLCLFPLLLAAVVSILLYIPPVQDFAVQMASQYAREATGMKINIGQIRLKFPIDLSVKDVQIINDTIPRDTILSLRKLTVSIRPLPLLDKEVLVESVNLEDVRVNTGSLIEGVEVSGVLGKLYLKADRINLERERAVFNEIRLSDTALTVLLSATEEDTTASEPVNWQFVLEKVNLDHVALACQMPDDSLRFSTYLYSAALTQGEVDLGQSLYRAEAFRVNNSELWYDGNYQPATKGLDANHIALSDVEIDLASLLYGGKDMNAELHNISFRERSGLQLDTLRGSIRSDAERIEVSELRLQTPHSNAKLTASVPWTSIDEQPSGSLQAAFHAVIGKEDVLMVAGTLPSEIQEALPHQPFMVDLNTEGNLESLRLNRMEAHWQDILHLYGQGKIQSPADSTRRSGQIEAILQAEDLAFILNMLPEREREHYQIPKDMQLCAEATFDPHKYEANLHFRESDGVLDASATYLPEEEAYKLVAHIDSLEPIHFMPLDSLLWLSASLEAEGSGMDFFSPKTWAKINGTISDIRYGNQSISDVRLDASLSENIAQVNLKSDYPLAKADVSLHAAIRKNDVKATFIADMQHIDLQGLHFSETPLATSFQFFAELGTDMNQRYDADISLGNWEVVTKNQTANPKMLILKAHSDKDTTAVSFHAGDLSLTLTADSGIMSLANQFVKISEDANRQMREDSVILLHKLRPLLPDLKLTLEAQEDNPLYNFLQLYGMEFKQIDFGVQTSPMTGIYMDGGIFQLARDTFRIDTVSLSVWQDTVGVFYTANVKKEPFMKQFPFSITIDGQLRMDYADALLRYADGRDSTGVLLGLQIAKEKEGIGFHLFPEHPVFAFSRFTLNTDNYIIYRNEKDIRANISLVGEQNASFRVHSHVNDNAMQQLHAELNQISLEEIAQAFPDYIPSLSGILNGDFQYVPSDSSFLVASGLSIDSLYYEGGRVGDLMINLVYLPLGVNEHQVDVHLFRDQEEILSATAAYRPGTEEVEDDMDGTLSVTSLPLPMLNPFIPDSMAKLNGFMQGEMAITGSTSSPNVEGYIQLDSATMFIGMINSTLRFDPHRITMDGRYVHFDNYSIYSVGENPFVIDGTVDYHDLANMSADLTLFADNMQLLDSKRTRGSLAYGRIFAGIDATAKGPLSSLSMRGDLRLLGGTNVTYVMQDSPLTVQDRLSGLVSFVSFAEDTIRRRRALHESLPLGGMEIMLTIGIDQAVQANVDLTMDQSSYVNLEGGGDLSFQYTPLGEMVLSGRYTLSGGTIRYSLPVIPLKEFTIQEGSYVQWDGNPMDPTLNLKATERIRTSVTSGESSTRMVNFDVGIAITQHLENLGLQFTLEAPEDATIQEDLARMGEEERAKQAVSMLVTGMYLAGGTSGKSKLDMGNALNSFLQSEINNIAGSALKTVDINFGMESYDEDGDGSKRTDYSFRFAKRFYNDRIRVVLGGRISTGADINQGQAQPFIDDVSIEYRLDASGTRYVKLFHNKDYESLLEGELTETGAGLVLRKKMNRLRELFIFRRNKTNKVSEDETETIDGT